MRRRVQFLGRENPLEEGLATHSSILAWRIPCTEEPGGLRSITSQRVGHWNDLAHKNDEVSWVKTTSEKFGGLSIICIRINKIFKQTFSQFFRTNKFQNRNRTSRVIKTAPSEDSQSFWNKCMNPIFYISFWKYTRILENCPRLVNNPLKKRKKR